MEKQTEEILYTLDQTCRTCLEKSNENLIPVFERNNDSDLSPIELLNEFHFLKLKVIIDTFNYLYEYSINNYFFPIFNRSR